MKIGIRAHDVVSSSTPIELVNKLKKLGISNIQLVFKKSFNELTPFNEQNAQIVSNVLKDNDINVSMLGAYFNPVHSNKELVRNNIEYFKEHLKYAHIMNTNYVGTETGSYNDDKWTYNPKNRTQEGYDETINVFKELVKTAEIYKKTILMEPAAGHVIYDIKTLKKAYDEINSEYLKVTIDIYNLLDISNYQDYKNIFKDALRTFKNNIKIIHLKDFNVIDNKLVQCGLGKGIIDFDYIISIASKYSNNATLIFEGVTGADIKNSLDLISKINN